MLAKSRLEMSKVGCSLSPLGGQCPTSSPLWPRDVDEAKVSQSEFDFSWGARLTIQQFKKTDIVTTYREVNSTPAFH